MRTSDGGSSSGCREGLDAYATVVGEDGLTRYAYEVDGRGGQLTGFDDANMPSLLGLPLLGYRQYSREVYANTRAFILSDKSPYFFSGKSSLDACIVCVLHWRPMSVSTVW